MGWKTEREHHFLSDMEFNYFCLLNTNFILENIEPREVLYIIEMSVVINCFFIISVPRRDK